MKPAEVETPRLTYGERMVGLTFNAPSVPGQPAPGFDPQVDAFKRRFAEIIDDLFALRERVGLPTEQGHLARAAIDHAITAQMWAVKAATFAAPTTR